MREKCGDMVDGRSVIKLGQIDILEVLYKYRFGSRVLIANALGVSAVTLHKKLVVLVKHGLVATKYDGSAKIQGRPVAYFLTPKGIRFLQSLEDHSYISDTTIKASYRDKALAPATISHCLQVFSHILRLKHRYQELKAYLRRDMNRFSYFPEPQPDAFLSLSVEGEIKRFFLDVIPDTGERKPLFQRVSAYIDFFDKGGWEVTNTEPPILLFIAETSRAERMVRRMVKGALSHLDPDNVPEIFTTTQKAIESMDSEALIWTALGDDELVALTDM